VPLHFGKWLGTGGTLETSHASRKRFLSLAFDKVPCWWCHQPRLNVVNLGLASAENIRLRATFGQPRLADTTLPQDTADKLNLKAISQEFVCASDKRSNFLEITQPMLLSQLCGYSLYPTDYFV